MPASSLPLPPHVATSAHSSPPALSLSHKRSCAATSLPPPHPLTSRLKVLPVGLSRKSTVTSTLKHPALLKNLLASCLRALLVRQHPLLPFIPPPPTPPTPPHHHHLKYLPAMTSIPPPHLQELQLDPLPHVAVAAALSLDMPPPPPVPAWCFDHSNQTSANQSIMRVVYLYVSNSSLYMFL